MAEPATQNQDLSDLRYPKPAATSAGDSRGLRPVDLPGFVHSPQTVPPVGTIPPDRQLPEETSTPNFGEIAGTALRRAADRARQFAEIAQDRLIDARERLSVLGGRFSEDAKDKAAELRDTAQERAAQVRTRARRAAHDYPIQFIAGSAAAAFVIGFVLGVWRDPRE